MLQRFRQLSRSRKALLIGGVLLAYLVVGMSGGCNAYRRPPELNTEERALLRSAPLPYSVTVAWTDEEKLKGLDPEAYGGALAKLVTASGSFTSSRYERSATPSGQGLVATTTGLYCNTATIPVLTLLSLGVIPTVFKDEQCTGMLLRTSAGRPRSEGVQVEVRYEGSTVMGWAGVVMGALPGWSHGEIVNDPRYAERFRLAIIRRREDIDRLAAR